MTIYFGLALDDIAYPPPDRARGGVRHLGPAGLLGLLESHLGLGGHPNDNDYLRIERFRQELARYLSEAPDAFFAASFHSDQFATAAALLARRDELLMGGWDFITDAATPPRLRQLAEIARACTAANDLPPGFADRLLMIIDHLPRRRHPVRRLTLVEPRHLLPPHLDRLLTALEKTGVEVRQTDEPPAPGDDDLGRFRRAISREGQAPLPLRADGSLIVLRAQRDTDAAAFLAELLRRNPGFRPLCLAPEKNRTLDLAIARAGLPSLGIPSASPARPTLQVLKLITVFLWEPINPFKVMEFVSLAVKPLDDELAHRIAEHIAQTPGLGSESWHFMIRQFFDQHPGSAKQKAQIRSQYEFWFERRRYSGARSAPKSEVVSIFRRLFRWAADAFEQSGERNTSLLVLAEQARRITELLEVLPETELSSLELERIVRTIYEPAPVQFAEERDHLPYVHHPNAIIRPAEALVWWNFVQNDTEHFFSPWYREELRWLAERNVFPPAPEAENALLVWTRKRPVRCAGQRLVLVIPQTVEGEETTPHPLFGNLKAAFTNLEDITYDLDHPGEAAFLSRIFERPATTDLPVRRPGRTAPFLRLRRAGLLAPREYESFTSLETLLYYPHQWVFRHKIQLRRSSILSVVKDRTLMGNLAHRIFEKLFRQDIDGWDSDRLARWIDEAAKDLLRREGAVLLLYGREPERADFIKRLKFSAWSLINLIRNNGWRVAGAEQPIEGDFAGLPLRARADLVLEKDGRRAVIDLKWRGARRRENLIRNEEDLQLVLYGKLLGENGRFAHTAFFILENGRLVARNNEAFREVTAVAPDVPHQEANARILQRMEATLAWRSEQLRRGEVEIRCRHTCDELDEHYGDELLDLLEMRSEDDPFDDYLTLIAPET